jgi:hypothetical protein
MGQTITCKDCGFLAFEEREVSKAERIELRTRSASAGKLITSMLRVQPERISCAKKLWTVLDRVDEEIDRPRQKCTGFFRHEGGISPAQHFELQEQRRREGLQWRIAMLGFFGVVLVAFKGSFLRDIPHWLVSLWRLIVKPS